MAFQFVDNQQLTGSQVEWQFDGLQTIYRSQPHQWQRNVDFWRKRLGIQPGIKAIILNGTQVEDAVFEVIPNANTTNNATVESDVNLSTAQSSVAESATTAPNPVKRQRRKKTTDL